MFCGERGKRGTLVEKSRGLWHGNVVIVKKLMNIFLGEENCET
jgi:hypothetical protein